MVVLHLTKYVKFVREQCPTYTGHKLIKGHYRYTIGVTEYSGDFEQYTVNNQFITIYINDSKRLDFPVQNTIIETEQIVKE